MKDILRKLLWPVLSIFESDDVPDSYKDSHRMILVIVGFLFLVLSFGAMAAAYYSGVLGGLIPGLVFFIVGFVVVTVGSLGSNAAVAKIWRSK